MHINLNHDVVDHIYC